MKTASTLLAATLLSFAAIACQQTKTTSNEVDANLAGTEVETLPADEGNPSLEPTDNQVDAVANGSQPTAVSAKIPAQYQGRWGMVPADCTSTRGDAKGLIAIDDKTIKFYESRATLKEQRPAIATSFAGEYAFTGEGQEWTKVVTLTRTGDKLKRADDEGSFDYSKCA